MPLPQRTGGRSRSRASARDERAELTLAVAMLRCENLKQSEIAERLGISQPEVSRHLQAAKELKWLVSSVDFQRVPEALAARVRQRFFAHRSLRKRLERLGGSRLRCSLYVTTAGGQEFNREAAEVLAQLLGSSDTVGVIWGRTLRDVVAELPGALVRRRIRPRHWRFVPLCGEPLHLSQWELDDRYSSSHLAADLGALFAGRDASAPPYMRGVPAYVSPSCFDSRRAARSLAAVRAFIESAPGYRRVFGPAPRGERPELEGVDTIVTSVGAVARKRRNGAIDVERTGAFLKERAAQEPDVSLEDLARWLYGDMGGVLLPRPGLPAAVRRKVEAMNEGWVGMTADRFRRCARRAARTGKPGVVALARSPWKAPVVKAALSAGMVNVLIVNQATADALERELQDD